MLRQQILIFLLFLPLLCFGQVVIDKSIFEGVNRSIILVSKEDGYTVFEDTLIHEDPIADYIHSIRRANEEEWLNLTIINIIDTLFEYPIEMTCSYLDIADDFFIDNKSDFLFDEPFIKSYTTKIRIHGIESLQQCLLPEHKIGRFKSNNRTKTLKIKTTIPYGENLYIPILANNEESYRYLFIPDPVPHLLNVEWDNLEKAVIDQSLSFPKGATKVEIKALSDMHEGETTIIKQEKINGAINLIVPLDMELYDIQVAYSLGEARKKIDLSDLPEEIKKVPLKYKNIDITNHGFEIYFNREDDDFILDIKLANKNIDKYYIPDEGIAKYSVIEHWIVLGKTSEYIKFEFPRNEDFMENHRSIETSKIYILDDDGEYFYWSIPLYWNTD